MMLEEQQLIMSYGVMFHFLVMLVSQEQNKQMHNSKKKNSLLHLKSVIAISW